MGPISWLSRDLTEQKTFYMCELFIFDRFDPFHQIIKILEEANHIVVYFFDNYNASMGGCTW